MLTQFVVLKSLIHQIDCYCPCCHNTDEFHFLRGDCIEIVHDRKIPSELGWYVQIVVNNQYQFYIALDDLKHYYDEGKICSLLDLELQANYFRYQVNQALDEKDKERFMKNAEKLKNVEQLREKVEEKMKVQV